MISLKCDCCWLYPIGVMTNEELLKVINALPDDAKRRVEEFIAKIRDRYHDRSGRPINRRGSFKDEPFFGMWADREDMKEGGAA